MSLQQLSLTDLVIGLLVVGSVLGALKARRGLLGALASGVGTAVVVWLLAAAVVVWAPAPVASAVGDSQLLALVPPPVRAAQQADQLLGSLLGGEETSTNMGGR